jgi:hypothetical protein
MDVGNATGISEIRIATIFRVEISILRIEAAGTSETLT